MKNYFLVLDENQKNIIQETGVESCDLNIDGHAGVVVDEENLSPALQLLGMTVSTETKTSLEGIVKVELVAGVVSQSITKPKGEVMIEKWDGRQKNEFKKLVEEILVPSVGTDVVLSVPHKKTVAPVSDGKFHIFIWSAPPGQGYAKPPSTMWDFPVDCRDESFVSSDQGIPILDPETDWAVAEMVEESDLYIHHDICHEGTDAELSIFRRLLEKVVVELSVTLEERAERQHKLAEERRRKSRKQYMAECSRRFEKTLKGTKQKIYRGHREIEELQKKLTRKIREVCGAERKLEQLNAATNGQLESYGKEFDSLSSVPGVEDVQVSDGVIKVFTEHVYITPDGRADTYDIGKFRMEIYTSGANGGIRFFNLTRKGNGDGYNYNIHHPHVNSSGSPCLGNISEMVAQLIGEYEYSAVTQLGLQYLNSVNTDDSAGKGIFKYWPKKEDK